MPLVIKSKKTLAQLNREKRAASHRNFQMLKISKPKASPTPKGASMKSLEAGAKKIQAAIKAKDKAEFDRLTQKMLKHFGPEATAKREAKKSPAEKAKDAERERKWHQKRKDEKKAAAKKRGAQDGQSKAKRK